MTSDGGSGSVTGSGTIYLGHPASHRHQRLVAARRHSHLQRHAYRRGRQHRRLRGGHGHARQDRADRLHDHRRSESDRRQPGYGREFHVCRCGGVTTYSYTVTSSGGSGSVTGSGTVLSSTQQVTGIDVSSLPDGTLTYSVTLTDAAGNVGSAATATATLDKTAPTGYAIAADQSLISSSQGRRDQLHLPGAEIGATYSYTVTSGGGGGIGDRQRNRSPRPPSRSPASTSRRCPTERSPTASR